MARRLDARNAGAPVRCPVCGHMREGGDSCPRCGTKDDGARHGGWSLMPRVFAALLVVAVLLAVGAAVAAGVWAALQYG